MWHLVMLVLLIVALIVVIIVVFYPSLVGLNHTGEEIDKIKACKEWNRTGCSQSTYENYKGSIGCKDYEECLTICKNLASCW